MDNARAAQEEKGSDNMDAGNKRTIYNQLYLGIYITYKEQINTIYSKIRVKVLPFKMACLCRGHGNTRFQ